MKLKHRLITSFLIIMCVPFLLAFLLFWGITRAQKDQEASQRRALYFANSLSLLQNNTSNEIEILKKWADKNPGNFKKESLIRKMNESLQEKHSFLIQREGFKILFDGSGDDINPNYSELPEFGRLNDDETLVDTIRDIPVTIRQVNYGYGNGVRGSVFVFTTANKLLPEGQKILFDYLLSALLILLFTAGVLISWLYGGIMPKVKKMQKAAEEIENGKLDHVIDVKGSDELTDLARAMERMRKRLSADAIQKIEAEDAQRQLISNIAHDLKTPLTSITGYSEGILDGIANTPEKQEKYVRIIHSKAKEMNALLNELSIYSKIETDRIPYNFVPLDVGEFFQNCNEEVGMDLASQDIGLSYYNELAKGCAIIADPEQLTRVVHNIIGNAVKYKKPEGNLSISIRLRDAGDYVQVEIEDNGQGISKEDLPHIFDRLYRGDKSRNTKVKGSGIGLSIVKKIISDHGGQIWATSKLGEGSVFYFVLRKHTEPVKTGGMA